MNKDRKLVQQNRKSETVREVDLINVVAEKK